MEADRTILFADISGSTDLTVRIGDQEAQRQIAALLDELRTVTRQWNGVVIKTIGDEVMSAFATPLEGLGAAVDMQRRITSHPPIRGRALQIRVGVHSGRVVVADGDLFGDVVNVAARVAALATAGQVLTTRASLHHVDSEQIKTRSLGSHQVRGREAKLELCEVLWSDSTKSLTALAPKLDDWPEPELQCRLGNVMLTMSKGHSAPLTLGRGPDCSLTVVGNSVSRSHAAVVRRGRLFVLEDHSTNGTYVKPDDSEEMVVHLGEIVLQGSGVIRLGESTSVVGTADIEYRIVAES
jgi:adenylate cyclase